MTSVTRAYVIYAQRPRGPRLFFDGRKFTNNLRPRLFASESRAIRRGRELIARYPALRKHHYHVWTDVYVPKARGTRANPDARADPQLQSAAEKLEEFTGHTARRVLKKQVKSARAGLVVGELDLIGYRVKREGVENGRLVRYAHQFRKTSRPLLAVSSDGKQLLIVGGRYEFTEAGIEDR